MLTLLIASTASPSTRAINGVLWVVYLLTLGVAAYLALVKAPPLPGMASKAWMLVLALVAPEVFVASHGLSAAAANQPFFSSVLGAPYSWPPSTVDTPASPSSPTTVTSIASSDLIQ